MNGVGQQNFKPSQSEVEVTTYADFDIYFAPLLFQQPQYWWFKFVQNLSSTRSSKDVYTAD